MLNALVIITAIIQILVGLLVYRKGRNSLTNIMFGVISLVTLAWSITNYVYTIDPTSSAALYIIRGVLFFVVLQNTAFYIFAKNYPSTRQTIKSKELTLFLIFSIIAALATLSPFVFTSVTIANGQSNPNPAPLIGLFLLHAIYSIVTGMRALLSKFHRAVGRVKKQLVFIIFASVLIWVFVPITNFVITLAFHTTFFARISPIYTLLFAGIIAYAIISQKLFDIQAAIARSVAYTLTLASLAVTYILAAFVLPTQLFNLQSTSTRVQIIYALLALVLAFSFQSVKQVFDKLSNRFFYQDAYEPQELLNKINRVLATTTRLDRMLSKTLELVNESLKSEFSAVVLQTAESKRPRIIDMGTNDVFDVAIANTYLQLVATKKLAAITVADNVPLENKSLRNELAVGNVAILAHLGRGVNTKESEVGYLLLGPKRSGNPYSSQDVRIIEIITNELVIAIQNALRFEEIERFNETLQREIATATYQLRQTNAKLRKVDRQKDEFIGMASHQLRTPLTSIKGYVSLVLDNDAGRISGTQRKLLEQAFTSSQRMVYLIADLLNVSRLKSGKFVIERVPTNLSKMISDEMAQLKTAASTHNVTLTFTPPNEFPTLMLDETKTRQVIMNFLDNAIYYTPTGGHIAAVLRDLPKSIEFEVTDDGIGVPKAERHHLFTKFYRAKNAQRARPDGTGLGLFMAQKVIIAQGGAIIFDSKEGVGSKFGFSFPKEMPAGAAELAIIRE